MEHNVDCSTLVELLRRRAQETPGRLAYVYLKDGEDEAARWTYAELDLRVRRIAAALQRLGCEGERALLVYPPGLDFISAFFGCLYAGTIAVPVHAPHPARLEAALPRLRSIERNSEPRVLLTSTAAAPVGEAVLAGLPELTGAQLLVTDDLTEGSEAGWREPRVMPETLAFLQYTSGSTAMPKGVMVAHRNLMHNIRVLCEEWGTSPNAPTVSWLPMFHDLGLIAGVLHPMLANTATYLMAPAAFVQRPLRWLEAISRYRASVSGGPNFAYDLCVRRTTPPQRAAIDLSSWETAYNGAEPVRADTIARFNSAFADSGFHPRAAYPCYGLAEGTLIVSGGSLLEQPVIAAFEAEALGGGEVRPAHGAPAPTRRLVSCGPALGNQRVAVVDHERAAPACAGRVGEIWVSGPSVAQGYWRLPDETERIFHATLRGAEGERFLRTGDLGFWHGGELYIAGRLKDLIIIDGRNHYPQDIELTIEQSDSAFRPGCSAAFSIDRDGAERLVVAAEVDLKPPASGTSEASSTAMLGITNAARRAVAVDHDVTLHELVLLRPGTVPKTTSGKIQRHACRNLYLAGTIQSWSTDARRPRTQAATLG